MAVPLWRPSTTSSIRRTQTKPEVSTSIPKTGALVIAGFDCASASSGIVDGRHEGHCRPVYPVDDDCAAAPIVMAGHAPSIHDFPVGSKDVDGGTKSRHDVGKLQL